jgi:NAD+ synthase
MTIKFAVAQLNPIVGDIAGNIHKIIKAYEEARAANVDIVVVGECAVTGYPIEDLVLRPSFMDAVEAETVQLINFVNESDGPSLVFGTPARLPSGLLGKTQLFNTAVFAYSKRDLEMTELGTRNGDPITYDVIAKSELPNYGVFDEKRVFVSGMDKVHATKWREGKLGIMICEDTWFPRVANLLAEDGAEFLISINGSPYENGKRVVRRQVVANRIKETGLPLLYVNLVGGQDELVFDGGSFGFDGHSMFTGAEFTTGVQFWTAGEVLDRFNEITDWDWTKWDMIDGGDVGHMYRASVLATRDYLTKQGFNNVVIGYSGGVDSGIVAAIAVDALGTDKVTLVSLPSGFSSDHSKSDALEGAKRLGVEFRTIDIEPVVEALRVAYESTAIYPIMEQLDKVRQLGSLVGVADENIQARARGTILMSISNQEGKVVLTTGNKSEVSVGYATLYGDMAGGYNPIKDFYKTKVWDACRWRNALTPEQAAEYGFYGKGDVDVVPEEIIVKPPSAELRPDQKDSDSLPAYPVLDDILERMVELEQSSEQIINSGHTEAEVLRVRRLLDGAEYKRRQAAPGVKLTSKLHGRERRYPIVNKWRG